MTTSIQLEWTTVFTDATTAVFIPGTGWSRADARLNRARRNMELRGRVGSITVKAAIQKTNDVNDPGTSFTEVGSGVSAGGLSNPGSPTTIDLEGYNYVRAGWSVVVASGNGAAAVAGRVDLWQTS